MTLLLAIRQHEIVVVIKQANHRLSKRQGDQRKQIKWVPTIVPVLSVVAMHREKATILSRVLLDSLSFQIIVFQQILFIGVLILTNDLPWRS